MKIGQNYINGKWVDSESKLTTINPNTGSTFGEIPNSNIEEVESAIASAKEAFISWSKTSIEERIKIRQNVVNLLIEEYGEEGMPSPLKNLITDEVGKRLPEADIEVIESSDMIQYFVDNAKSILADRRAILMIDGFDEVPDTRRKEVLEWVEHLCKNYSGNRIILTSRPTAFSEGSLKKLCFQETMAW